MTELVVQNLSKRYGGFVAVDDVSFTVADGEFVTLLGPSGCGKSTTLAAIAGLDTPSAGTIRTGAQTFYDGSKGIFLPAEARNCGLVFQSYALWPHLTVRRNVAFPLSLRKVTKDEQKKRIDEVLDLVEMGRFSERYPHELSGGQQQRVALARTLVYRPSVLLLDEPLSNLDAKLRERAREWLGHIQNQVRLTTVYVTHDQLEALALSDRIAVMNGGKIVQLASPREIYETPNDPFVADFIGTSSFFRGRAESTDTPALRVRLSDGNAISAAPTRPVGEGEAVMVAVRPERIRLLSGPDRTPEESGSTLPARILNRSYLGARYQYEIEVGQITAKVDSSEELGAAELRAWIPVAGCVVFSDAARS